MTENHAAETEPVEPARDDERRGFMPIEEFTALASKLVSLSLYREAIGLYETAVGIYPENLALKINLARVREMKRRADEQMLRDLHGNIQERREREDLLAQRSLAAGLLHYRRSEMERAREFLEFCRAQNPNLYLPALLLARIYLSRGDLDRALEAAEDARRVNPLSEEAQSLLGRLCMEKKEHKRAVHALIDALVLSAEELGRHPFYHWAIHESLRRLGFTEADLPALLQDRQIAIGRSLEWLDRRRKEHASAQTGSRLGSILATMSQKAAMRPLGEAQKLRRFIPLERATDDDLLALHPLLRREELPADALLFQERDSTRKLYFLEKGEVAIRRMTPFGEVVFATYVPGQVCGEMDFLDGLGHSADAVCREESVVLTLGRADADQIFAKRPAFAVQCLSYFWRSLAEHIRTTNEQMKTFFVKEAEGAGSKLDERQISKAEKVIIDIQRKIALFREKGLSTGELGVLATLSSEERYGKDDLIFSEGDAGTKLYVVLDGKVRIGKRIPGVGEEALAILERGDFFGEMALVDDKPRSADATAHEDSTTVLAIDKRVLEDTLSQDLAAAEQFLSILCRILCQRLREINETIVKWKIMSGGF